MEGKVIFFISHILYNELTLLAFKGWILRKLECLPTEGSQLQWRGGMLVIIETWAADQNQYLNLGSYRIRSNLWVHGTIGACYLARDSKVETALVTTYHLLLPFSLRLPSAGGVYSPGYAFADTTLVARFWKTLFLQTLNTQSVSVFPFPGNFFWFQVEQEGCHIHICGRGYLIHEWNEWKTDPQKPNII